MLTGPLEATLFTSDSCTAYQHYAIHTWSLPRDRRTKIQFLFCNNVLCDGLASEEEEKKLSRQSSIRTCDRHAERRPLFSRKTVVR